MYTIIELLNGEWLCCVTIQDGYERWKVATREKAVQDVISGARILNGTHINESFITFEKELPPPDRLVSEEDFQLLNDIKRRAKIVLECDDYRLKYNLTKEECQMVQDIREGRPTDRRSDDRLVHIIANIAFNKHEELSDMVGFRCFDGPAQVDHVCRLYQVRLTDDERQSAILKSQRIYNSLTKSGV